LALDQMDSIGDFCRLCRQRGAEVAKELRRGIEARDAVPATRQQHSLRA
jgi:hypothetical protein